MFSLKHKVLVIHSSPWLANNVLEKYSSVFNLVYFIVNEQSSQSDLIWFSLDSLHKMLWFIVAFVLFLNDSVISLHLKCERAWIVYILVVESQVQLNQFKNYLTAHIPLLWSFHYKYILLLSPEFTQITGQKQLIPRAKKGMAGFEVQADVDIGFSSKLWDDRMYPFLTTLIFFAFAQIRDFQGLSVQGFDKVGNHT